MHYAAERAGGARSAARERNLGTQLEQERVNRLWEAVHKTASHEVVFELQGDGTVGWVTDAAEAIVGIPAAELVGENAFSIVYPDDVDYVRDVLTACVLGNRGWQSLRVRVRGGGGKVVWVESNGVAHTDERGLLGFTATAHRLDWEDARAAHLSAIRTRTEAMLRDRSLTTVWQPIYSLESGTVTGAEALTRFSESVTPPDLWFSEASEVGLGIELEQLALRTALASIRHLPDDKYLSINASPDLVVSGALTETLDEAHVALDRIVIELTEHVSIENYERLVTSLAVPRDAGARLAVDDAGAGFASFRHILKLQPEIIKLDRSITHGIAENPAQRALATAIVLYAFEVGSILVVAEGVETFDDLSTVLTLGFDGAQGFCLSRPMLPERVDWAATVPETSAPRRQARPKRTRSSS